MYLTNLEIHRYHARPSNPDMLRCPTPPRSQKLPAVKHLHWACLKWKAKEGLVALPGGDDVVEFSASIAQVVVEVGRVTATAASEISALETQGQYMDKIWHV